MDFATLPEEKKQELARFMLTPLSSALEIKDWAKFFLDLEIPTENTDPESTSNPLDAAWYVYQTFKYNLGNERPGAIMISARECMKTIMVTILELLLLLHFQLEVGHAAAIESQSSIALGYIEGFLFKIAPLLEVAGWKAHSTNKRVIKYKTPQGKTPFLKVVICSAKGMNGLHVSALFLDELDLADKAALKEGRNIVGFSRGIYGMQVYISSYKYSFGNVAEALEKADDMHYKVLKWNIMDLTERCPPERHKPDEPKQDMYVTKVLPLKNITVAEYVGLPDIEKSKYDLVSNAHAGCVKCPLLPLCKKKLATKDISATGGFYKPISSVIQKFRENDPDIAESQLLCRRPGSEGLVYPRFSKTGNVITVKEAYELLMGPTRFQNVSEATLLAEMQKLGLEFYCGVDFGFTHDFVILVAVRVPNGDWWLMETYSCPGLEFDDMLETAKTFRDKYNPVKWFCDTAMPAYIKSFNKNGMRCAEFKKDVLGGIAAVRSKITNSSGRRSLKILDTDNNKRTIEAIAKHRFQLDGQGNVTPQPADEPSVADKCFAPGTIIYTKNGVKNIEDIQVGDLVLTHTGKFEPVKKVMSREYSGVLLAIHSNCKPVIRSTPEHPFYLANYVRSTLDFDGSKLTGQRRIKEDFDFKPIGSIVVPTEADRKTKPIPATLFPKIEIENEDFVIDFSVYVPSAWVEKDEIFIKKLGHNGKINKKVILTEEIAFLIGYFVAEGSLSGNDSGVVFAGHQKEKRVMDLLEKATEQLGITDPIWRDSKIDNGRMVTISSTPLCSFMRQMGKEIHKKFPSFIHDLPRKQLVSMLAGYIFGDGHIKKNGGGLVGGSISANISFTLYAVLSQLGYRPTLKLSKRKGRWKGFGKNGIISNDMWKVCLGSSDAISFLEEAFRNELVRYTYQDKINVVEPSEQESYRQIVVKEGLASSILKIEKEHYEGLVYNLEVEGDNSYVANMSAVHNCDALRYLGQNLWHVRGTFKAMVEYTNDPGKAGVPPKPNYTVNEQMQQEIAKRIAGTSTYVGTAKKKGGFHFTN